MIFMAASPSSQSGFFVLQQSSVEPVNNPHFIRRAGQQADYNQ
jgi:hypothetical protein